MSLSRLAAKCRVCPKDDTCDHTEMEAYGFLPLPTQQKTMIFTEPSEEYQRSVDELTQEIARVFQIPERLLRGGE